MNELVKLENGKIVVDENYIKELEKFQKQKLKMDLKQETFKEQIKTLMEQIGADKFISNDGLLTINYFPEKVSKRLNSTKLKKEMPDIYEEFLKDVTTKAYVKVTVK